MKRCFPVFLTLCILLSACSAVPKQEEGFVFWLRGTDSTAVLVAQPSSVDPNALSPEALITRYLACIPQAGARSPFPQGWTLASAEIEGGTAVVLFSGSSDTADAYGRSIAYACLTKTLLQRNDVLRVHIVSPGDEEGMTLTDRDLLLTDTGMLPQQEELVLYYPDRSHRYLVAVRQTVDAMDASMLPEYALQQLLSAAERGEAGCIPAGTFLLGIQVQGGLCTVNLSSAFRTGDYAGYNERRLAVYSIVNTLTLLSGISAVSIQVSGEALSSLGLMRLNGALTFDASLQAPVSDTPCTDVDLYYPAEAAGGRLVAVPCAAEAEEEALPEAVLRALIAYRPDNGLKNYISEETRILSVRLAEGVCLIDLTADFLSHNARAESQQTMLRSVIATLCALPGIDSVEFLVEGLPPHFIRSSLSEIHRPEAGWFAE